MHRLIAPLAASLFAGCATVPPLNERLDRVEPDGGYRLNLRATRADNDPGTLLILAFSGGGARAAAFSYGVLEELRRTEVGTAQGKRRMLDEVDLITGVSGGSEVLRESPAFRKLVREIGPGVGR